MKKVPHKKLSDLAEIFTGIQVNPSKEGKEQVSTITIKDIEDGQVNIKSLNTINVDDTNKMKKFATQVGDIVLTIRGTQLKSAIITKDSENLIATTNLAIVRINELSVLKPTALNAFLNSKIGQTLLMKLSNETSGNQITIKSLKEILIPLLPAEVQEEIEKLTLSFLKDKEKTLEALKLKTDITKQLINKAFIEGKIRA